MYIVNYEDNTRHSAWNSKEGAHKQQRVLLGKGYKGIYVSIDDTVNTEDGHYYI